MTPRPILNDAMLERFAERARVYDRENRFFTEDFEELRMAGYLTIALPRELGGGGLLDRRSRPGTTAAWLSRGGDSARCEHACLLDRCCRRSVA